MTTGANITETHSISEARTGTIRVSRLVLTGWANAVPSASAGFKSFSDEGRLWGVYTSSSGDFSLYRRSTALSGDKVCSGTVSAGKVTLAQANSSGHSGSADVDNGTPGTNPDADATMDVVVSYADENDLLRVDRQMDKYLASGLYPGGSSGTRFESLLGEAKRLCDRWLTSNFAGRMRYDVYGRPLLAHIVRLGDVARLHALLAVYLAYSGRGEGMDEAVARRFAEAQEELRRLPVQFDYERDVTADTPSRANVVQIVRS